MLGKLLVSGVFGGAIAGAGTGAIDGLWSWSALSQFLPSLGGRLQLVLFLAAVYACAGALLGPLVLAVTHFFWRVTRLGDVARFGLKQHRLMRAREPGDALVGLALVLAGLPALGGVLAVVQLYYGDALALKKNMHGVVAVVIAATLAALVIAALLAFALARPIEHGLRKLARKPRWGQALSSPAAIGVALAVVGGAGAAAGIAASWETLSQINLRPIAIAALATALAWPSFRGGARVADFLARRRRGVSAGGTIVKVIALAAAVLLFGNSDGVIKAADAYSGLGGALTRAFRSVGDFDGDGFARILGGGDCDDSDPHVHPGAEEIPDDGIDQNCIGGDATMLRRPDEIAFVDALPAAVPTESNIILITIDTVRADHFGAYGYGRDTTPAIDALAKDGAVFRNAWAHAPSTRYSMPAILTGRYPLNVFYDMSVWWPALAPRATTVAELLTEQHFHTGAILNYDYFAPVRRMNQGFAEYDNDNAKLHRIADRKAGPASTRGSSSKEQTDKAIAFVERNAHRKFFLWVHYYDPHYQYEEHPGTQSFGDGRVDLYDQEIRYTDDNIGRLFQSLRAAGLYDKTVIVVTGDHGEGFGEHGIDLHGYDLYAAQTKVPLIVRVPGTKPVAVDTPVAHVDLLPTLVNLAGGKPCSEMQGRSLVDIRTCAKDPTEDRWVFQQLSYEGNHEKRGAASKQCHVLYNVSPTTTWELYRVDTDPSEARDVIGNPGPCAGARRELEVWYDQSELPAEAATSLLAEAPTIAEPLNVDFGDEVRLLDVQLPDGPVRPGATIDVTFTFAARGKPPDGWKLFAHFEAPGGGRFLGDHEPPRPFAWWRAGQFVRYTHKVTVPRNIGRGDYVLWLGMFKGNHRRSVGASDHRVQVVNDRAAVGVVSVQR